MDSGLINALANGGVAGVVLIVVIGGWLVPRPFFAKLEEENRLLREALDLERERAGDAAATASTTNQLIAALADLAADRRGVPSPPVTERRGIAGEWGDLI